MKLTPLTWVVLVTVLVIVVIIIISLVITEDLHPAYTTAVDFVTAAGKGDDATAFALLSSAMQNYVAEHCPDGSVSACVARYTPEDWGDFTTAVYRRSITDGPAWDVLLLASYEEGEGFAGVCIYNRVEEVLPEVWRVTAWSGFVSCDDSNAGLSGLRRDDAPNRAP
jgi:hypothetical protein